MIALPVRFRRRLTLGLSAVTVIAVVAVPLPAAMAAPPPGTLLVNGDFEDGPPPATVVFYGVGYSAPDALPGWTVPSGSVESDADLVTGGPWNAASGHYSLDLNADSPGQLYQIVTGTQSGVRYRLRFAVSVHPACGPATAEIAVGWNFDATGVEEATNAYSSVDPGWSYRELEVVAEGPQSDLTFTSLTPGSCGPLLDDVSLVPLDETTLSDVSLTATPGSTTPGAEQVPLSALPLDQLPDSALAGVAAAPLRSVPLRSVPLRSVPLRSVPLRSVPLRSVPLRSVTLNQIPLAGSPSWEQVLAGTPLADQALQQVTLDDVLLADPPRLAEVSLGAVDLSGSPLQSISVASSYLGPVAVGDLPLVDAAGAATGRTVFDAVCEVRACAGLELTSRSPVLAADLAGVPLRSVPLDAVPLRSVPTAAPLRSVPLRSVPLRSVPLRSVPLRSVDGLDIPAAPALAAITLGELAADAPLLAEVPYAAVAGTPGFPTCDTCATLAAAVAGGGPAAGTTLGRLAATGVLEGYVLADLGRFDASPALAALTVGSIADAIAPTFSLAQALLSLVDPEQVPWESLAFDALELPRHAVDGPRVRYDVSFTMSGGSTRDAEVEVTLPPEYVFVGGVTGLDPLVAEPTVTGRTLRWRLEGLSGGTTDFGFDAAPGLALVPGAAELAVSLTDPASPGSPALTGADSALVTVVGPAAATPADAPVIAPDTLVVGHTATPGGSSYLRLPVPPAGTRVTVHLSHLPADNDLTVFGPAVPGGTPSVAPLRSVPLRSVPLADPGVDAGGRALSVGALEDDLPLLPGLPLVGVSAQRGTVDDEVGLLSPGGGGWYTIQVSGYNGAGSPQPWMVRVRQQSPVEVSCPSRGYPAQQGLGPQLPAGVDAATRALFLVDEAQLRAEHGDLATAELLTRISTLAARADVAGALVRVDQHDGTAAAYTAWNERPCSLEAANDVVRSVSSLVLGYHAAHPLISSVTVVGGDSQVPHGRLPDLTSAVNERGFAAADTGPGGADNPFTASQSAGYLLSDDPYGTLSPVPWLGRGLYVPELAVGRLVETPAQITGQLEQFVAAGGVVDPQTSLTTGYDFLTDGAEAVDAALAGNIRGARQNLVSESWTRGDLLSRLLPTEGPVPSIASVNAHFDQSRALPAAEHAAGTERDLLTTEDLDAHPGGLTGSLLFSMGCHAGLSVPAGYSGIAGAPATADWPKQLASQRALWVANTGYGLGDTATVALSEQLMAEFAEHLDGTVVAGAALAFAKQAYLGSLGAYGAADEKALQEIVFYGLPMYRIGGPRSDGGTAVVLPAPAPVPTVPVTVSSDAVGLPSADAVTTPAFTRTDAAAGSFFGVGAPATTGETQTTAGVPIQPRTSRPAAPADTTAGVAHGVLVTSLSSHDVAGVTPRVGRAVVDLAALEPARAGAGIVYTPGIAGLSSFVTPAGPDTRLVLVPGQFFAAPDQVEGTQRLFDSVGTRTYYSNDPSHVPPTFSTLTAGRSGSSVTFTVDVGAAAGQTVQRVLVLVRDGSAAAWRPLDLTRGTGTSWSGTLSGTGGSVEWFAQAVSSAGTVGVSLNKGDLFGSPAVFAVERSGVLGDNGIYTGPVTLAVSGPSARYTATVDGVTQPVVGTVTISGDGDHVVTITGSSGDSETLVLRIDGTAPVVSVTDPAAGILTLGGPGRVELSCDDGVAGSGLATACPVTVTVSTASPGVFVLPVTLRDRAGNEAAPVTYSVRYRFSGFASPVSPAAMNVVKAGSTVPVKFSLASATAPVTSLGAVTSIASVRIVCGSTSTAGATEPPTSADPASLKVEDGGYHFRWKTPKSYAGQCRVLTITLADGSERSATFRLT